MWQEAGEVLAWGGAWQCGRSSGEEQARKLQNKGLGIERQLIALSHEALEAVRDRVLLGEPGWHA